MSWEDRYYPVTINGQIEQFPSVTTILRVHNREGLNIWRAKQGWELSEQYREETSEIGKEVHQYIHQLANGVAIPKLEWSLLSEEIKNSIRAYERFRMESGLKGGTAEMVVYNLELSYAGTLDRIGKAYNEDGLFDWKTGEHFYPSMLAQVVAYFHALPEKIRNRIRNLYSVGLNRNTGIPDIHRLKVEDSEPYWEYFKACLNLFNCDKKLLSLEEITNTPRLHQKPKDGIAITSAGDCIHGVKK